VNAVGRDGEEGVKVRVEVKVEGVDRASSRVMAARGSGVVGGRKCGTR